MRDSFFAAFMDELAKIAAEMIPMYAAEIESSLDPAEPASFKLWNKGKDLVGWSGTPQELANISKIYNVKPKYDRKTGLYSVHVPTKAVDAYRRKMKRVK